MYSRYTDKCVDCQLIHFGNCYNADSIRDLTCFESLQTFTKSGDMNCVCANLWP